ncbi:Fe(2+)/Mn(2+) transporter pcl1 [Nostocoides japonicum T1-X7]|uniref:Fe(2+)/Mn(2+) transporter pcl1 n=1 Tax=Nostocoides japonicum T1-X7 TaxID=1194083 RepID=A0A077M0K4_9MICO|nr:VIT family protein [Tetrasphaera japonica]CCH79376.1 Fe(2+)/Mn(2+) transporter pcl1 [Tetrasphaera japonica T1-X7]
MTQQPHPGEPHDKGVSGRLNALRAGVLGANDGIVSVAGIVIGVAAATISRGAIATAGIAGLTAGAMSMAAGEYVSVSTQRDTEEALVTKEVAELREEPEAELEELAGMYVARGLTDELAHEVARQLTAKDALAAHAEVELGIDLDDLANPWAAAGASMLAFTIGGLLPLVAILLPGPSHRVVVTVLGVLVALALTGLVSARLGDSPVKRPIVRNVAGGALAMAVTYGVGSLVGTRV